jgi:cell division protease FtsH
LPWRQPFSTGPATETQTWRYSNFLDAIQNNQIERVSISSDRTRARFTDPAGNGQIIVNLPNDPELISTLEQNNVDIVVLPQNDDSVWFGPSAPC